MATADGRTYKRGNRCACGKPISRYALRCNSCNMEYRHAAGGVTYKGFKGPHTPETRAKMSAAHKGRKLTPEQIAKRIASDRRCHRPDKAPLRDLYLGQGLSCAEIARRLGCNQDTVRRAMDRCGIPRRSKAEESRLRYAENPVLRQRLREGASRHNRIRWQDPTYRKKMSAVVSASNRRRTPQTAARNRAR